MSFLFALVALPIAGFGLVALERWISLNFPNAYSQLAFLPIGEPQRVEVGEEVRDRMRHEQSATYRDPALGRPEAHAVPWPPTATAHGAKYHPLPGDVSLVQMPPRVVYGGSPGGVARIDARVEGDEIELTARYAPLGLAPAIFASVVLALFLLPKVAVFIIPALMAGTGLNVVWSHWRARPHVDWALEYVQKHLVGLEAEAAEAKRRAAAPVAAPPHVRIAADEADQGAMAEAAADEVEEPELAPRAATATRTRDPSE